MRQFVLFLLNSNVTFEACFYTYLYMVHRAYPDSFSAIEYGPEMQIYKNCILY